MLSGIEWSIPSVVTRKADMVVTGERLTLIRIRSPYNDKVLYLEKPMLTVELRL